MWWLHYPRVLHRDVKRHIRQIITASWLSEPLDQQFKYRRSIWFLVIVLKSDKQTERQTDRHILMHAVYTHSHTYRLFPSVSLSAIHQHISSWSMSWTANQILSLAQERENSFQGRKARKHHTWNHYHFLCVARDTHLCAHAAGCNSWSLNHIGESIS